MSGSRYLPQDEATLRDAAQAAVDRAMRLGADAASVIAQAGGGVRVVVREGVAETRLREGTQSIGLTIYRGGRTGTASAAAFDDATIARIAAAAVAITVEVQSDADAGLPDPAWLAWDDPAPPLSAPIGLSPDALLAQAHRQDAAVRDAAGDRPVRVTEAGVATTESALALATSSGFCRSVATTSHGRWAMVLARARDYAVQDFAQSSERVADRLVDPAALARLAIERATTRLGARVMPGGRMPVLFDARVAGALVRDMVAALGGHAQHRGATWLPDAVGRTMLPPHVDLIEDPTEPWGMASGAFDGEGIAGVRRHVVRGGVVEGLFLSALPARRLGMRSTGNAGGPWNLRLTGIGGGDDAAGMRERLGTGLLVTQILGGSTDPVTGTWTHAVAGFRVTDGALVHPVSDITLGGSIADMVRGIAAIGGDVERQGAVSSGSILIDAMTVGAAA